MEPGETRKCAEKAFIPKGVLSEFKGERKEEILNGRRNSMNHSRAERKSMVLLRNSRMVWLEQMV